MLASSTTARRLKEAWFGGENRWERCKAIGTWERDFWVYIWYTYNWAFEQNLESIMMEGNGRTGLHLDDGWCGHTRKQRNSTAHTSFVSSFYYYNSRFARSFATTFPTHTHTQHGVYGWDLAFGLAGGTWERARGPVLILLLYLHSGLETGVEHCSSDMLRKMNWLVSWLYIGLDDLGRSGSGLGWAW